MGRISIRMGSGPAGLMRKHSLSQHHYARRGGLKLGHIVKSPKGKRLETLLASPAVYALWRRSEKRLTGGFCGEKKGARQATVGTVLAPGQRQKRGRQPMGRRRSLPSVLPGLTKLGAPCNYQL